MYFGEYLFKEKTKYEIFSYVIKNNEKGCRPQMRLIKESEVHTEASVK
jgi:hypothetical protein